jgi:hypothetical protein
MRRRERRRIRRERRRKRKERRRGRVWWIYRVFASLLASCYHSTIIPLLPY